MLTTMFNNSNESEDGEEEEKIEKGMQEFFIHPIVYPSLDSLTADLHFKTFK